MAGFFNPKAELRVRLQYEQVVERTQKVRLRWFRNNYERVYLNPSVPAEKIPKKAAVLFNAFLNLESIAAEERKERLKKRKVAKPEVSEGDQADTLTAAELLARGPMYPVPKKIKEVLYNGISHNDEGRRLYLKLRNKKGVRLEEKFYTPLSYTQGYGWMVQERFFPEPRYGRRQIIQQSFTRRNGALKGDNLDWRGPQMESLSVVTI